MSRTFNILLVVGCVVSVAAAFIFSVKPAGTTNAAIVENETTIPLSLPALTADSLEQHLDKGIARKK